MAGEKSMRSARDKGIKTVGVVGEKRKRVESRQEWTNALLTIS